MTYLPEEALKQMHGLQSLVGELEHDRSLEEPDRLRQRIEALDRLEVYLPDRQLSSIDSTSIGSEIYPRAKALCTRLEQANFELYQTIHREIRRAIRPYRLFHQMISQSSRHEDSTDLTQGESYDYLDELVSGILQFEHPAPGTVQLSPEMVFYQPTPARHIFDLVASAALTESDVLIDLGSGLGHVPLLATICTGISSIGIELESAYVDCARKSAQSLNLNNVLFLQQDARSADLSSGTVFYLYTPFLGTILRTVLYSLRREATNRKIRICTFGPCTEIVAEEQWLELLEPLNPHRITLFCSRD